MRMTIYTVLSDAHFNMFLIIFILQHKFYTYLDDEDDDDDDIDPTYEAQASKKTLYRLEK